MDPAILAQLAAQFGPMGLLVGYLIWREQRRDKIDTARIEADVEMARAINTLSVKLDGMSSGR